jgi:hypothetical protein
MLQGSENTNGLRILSNISKKWDTSTFTTHKAASYCLLILPISLGVTILRNLSMLHTKACFRMHTTGS